MDDFKKLTSNEWGAPYKGPSTGPLNGIEQRDRNRDGDTTVAAILAKDEERQIQGVDIRDQLGGLLDDKSASLEEQRELEESEAVARAARANQG